MRDNPDSPRESLRRREPRAAIYRVIPDASSAVARRPSAVLRPVPPGSRLVELYLRFEGVVELLHAFLEKTDPQGPDTLGELFRAIWHRLLTTPDKPPGDPDRLVRTVGNVRVITRAAGKFTHVLFLTSWAGVVIVKERIKHLLGLR